MRWPAVLLALGVLGACGDPKDTPADAAVDAIGADESTIDAPDPDMPATLAETGLCVDAACTQIASGVYPYTPRFELWSDTATKKRWIYLPPGTTIDTSDMDHWIFPVGTKLWKEFTRDGTRVETRLVMRIGAGDTQSDWFYGAYVWNAAQDAAVWAEFGENDANGTEHDVPSKTLCRVCHENNKPSRVLGFSAIQLDIDGASGEIDLADAIASGWLSAPPSGSAPYYPLVPDAPHASVAPALGYLHANCGHCHNPNSAVDTTTVHMRLTVGTVSTVAATPVYQTAVNQEAALTPGVDIVEPGMPSMSNLFGRFTSANTATRMPQLGTEMIDPTGQGILEDWITNIP